MDMRLSRYFLVLFAATCFSSKGFSENSCDTAVSSNRTISEAQMLLDCKKRGDDFFNEGKLESAKAEYSKLLHSILGLTENLSKGINTNNSFIERAEANYDEYGRKGYLCRKGGDLQGAVDNFSKMIEINYLYPYGYIMRALTYRDEKLYDGSLADLATLIGLYPDFYYSYKLQGEIFYEQKSLDKALAALTKTIELAPDSSDAYFLRGNVFKDMGDSQAALKDYSKAVEISKDIRAYYNRGVLYFSNGQYDNALPDFIYISETETVGSPYLRHVYWRIANIYIGRKDFVSAVGFLDKLINIQPCDPWAYQQKGHVCLQMKMYDKALASFELALKFDPSSTEIKQLIKDMEKVSVP